MMTAKTMFSPPSWETGQGREELEHRMVSTVTNRFPGENGSGELSEVASPEDGGKERKELRHQLSVVKATNFCAQGALSSLNRETATVSGKCGKTSTDGVPALGKPPK